MLLQVQEVTKAGIETAMKVRPEDPSFSLLLLVVLGLQGFLLYKLFAKPAKPADNDSKDFLERLIVLETEMGFVKKKLGL